MERIVAITAVVFGALGLVILALAWLIQQRRPRPKAGRAKKEKAPAPGTREKPKVKEDKVNAREKPIPDEVYCAAASAPMEKEEGTGQSHLNEKEEASVENLLKVREAVPGEKLQEIKKNEQRTGGLSFEGGGHQWYTGVFPARALIEELSLLNKLRDILKKTGEIHEAIRAVKPDFNQESKIAEFIFENNLQYFKMVSRQEGITVYIREGQQCLADNDRCIYYKGYVWLNPDWVDFDLSSQKP